jgi:hypothetical protein
LLCAEPVEPLPFELCVLPALDRLRADWLRPRVRDPDFVPDRLPLPEVERERDAGRERVVEEPLSDAVDASSDDLTDRDACVAVAARARLERFADVLPRFDDDARVPVARALVEALLPARPPPDAAASLRAAVPALDLLRDAVLPR